MTWWDPSRVMARRYCFILAVATLIGAGSSTTYAGVDESRIAVKGPLARTEIVIDRWGVPHIFASSMHDAFFAQGWNVSRDRLWQIDLWRRSGLGELAAALGPAYVAQDRAARLFRYRGDMTKEWAAYGPDAERDTKAFVDGINAYVTLVKSDPSRLPLEFKLAGYQPASWTADDVVRVRNRGLSSNVGVELARAQILCRTHSLETAALLFKISPPWVPVVPEGLDLCTIPPGVLEEYALAQKSVSFVQNENASAGARLPGELDLFRTELEGNLHGSNNWVIAPSKSTTGRPILANDPHRDLQVPSLRYIVHLSAPGLNVIGAGEPALPGIAIGHNENIAFGVTVFPIAQEDLYVYETNLRNRNEYRYRNRWELMRVERETVAVRGGSDVVVELKFTRHGPIVFEDPQQNRAYAVRAAWLDTGGAPYFASMRYLRARNIKEFSRALKYWGDPGENQLYADTTGRIAWFPVGFTPIRSNSDGLLPLPGDGRYEWGGYLDRDQLPSEVNPPRGYIATANQMNLPVGYPYAQRRVSFSWFDDFRFLRISDVLNSLPKVSLWDSQQLQNDYVSLPAHRLVDILDAISTKNGQLKDVVHWLKDWDGRVTADSPQAALFEVWCSNYLVPSVFAQAAPKVPRDWAGDCIPETILGLLEQPDDRLGRNPTQSRDDLMLRTLAEALEDTSRRLGPNRSTWQWGDLVTVLFEHPLSVLASEDLRLKMNVGPRPKSGDGDVVGLAGYRKPDFRVVHGASFRMVLDVGRWDNSLAINAPGQSGDPSSPHYRDLFPLWVEDKYFPLVYSRMSVEKAAEHRIVLEPIASTNRPH